LSISRQCDLLGIHRSQYYGLDRISEKDKKDFSDIMLILEILKEHPFKGYRRVSRDLIKEYPHLTRKRVRRLMHRSGLRALFPKHRTTQTKKGQPKYPYLLRNKQIRYPNQVWSTDLTYIHLPGGYVYLAVIMDLYSRKILSWRLSNTMDTQFCIDALEEAILLYGEPAIFNSDHGSQFVSNGFLQVLKDHHIEISMDGIGRALDNIYVERFWRSLKYEDIYLKSYETMQELKYGVNKYMEFYNTKRFHQSLEYQTPDELYESFSEKTHFVIAA